MQFGEISWCHWIITKNSIFRIKSSESKNKIQKNTFRTAFGRIRKSMVKYKTKKGLYDRRKPFVPVFESMIITSLNR